MNYPWQATVQDDAGNAVVNPVVTVWEADGVTLATIYDVVGAVIPNPITGSLEGFVQFWTSAGSYIIEGAKAGEETEPWHVIIGGVDSGSILVGAAVTVSGIDIRGTTDLITTSGYHSNGDGGAASYRRVPAEPAHAGKLQSADGAWWEISVFEVNVRQFGAKGDGVSDDTAAIAAADGYSRSFSTSKSLFFGNGVFMVSQMVIYAHSNWRGLGKGATIIRQIGGSNTHLFYGINSTDNFSKASQADYIEFPYDFEIDGFDLDMQWTTTDKLNTSGHAFFVVGDHYNVKNLFIRNAAECGIVKKFIGDHPSNYDSRYLETAFKHVRVDYCGKHGFWDLGPHDSLHEDIIVLDAGQSENNTYDGFNHDGSSSRNIAIHAATRQGRLRMRYSVSTWSGSSNEWSGGSNIEGAETANLGMFSSGNQFDPSTRFYAAWGGVNILLGGTCTLNIIRGNLQGPPAGRPACAGIKFSTDAADTVAQNDIDVLMSDQDGGAFQFNASNKGGNRLRAKVYTTANVGVFGTVSPLDDVLIRGTVNGSARYELSNMVQSAFLASIPAGGSYTWTFPYAFNKNPNVQVTPTSPTSALTTPLWVSDLGPTSVTIFNPNASAHPVNVLATGVY